MTVIPIFIYMWVGLVIWAVLDSIRVLFYDHDKHYYRDWRRMMFVVLSWPMMIFYRPNNLKRVR